MFTKPLEVVMKNLLIALVVLSSLVSCGKKNVAGATTAVNGLTSPMVASTAVESDFITRVNGNQFGTGNYQGMRFTDAIAHGSNPQYQYANYTAPAAVSPNCHSAWVFQVCNSSSSSSYQAPVLGRKIDTLSVATVTKQNEIIAIYNSKAQVFTNGNSFKIITTDNKTYFFDTTLPIQANPTQSYNANGSGEYLINVI
jgi:hypothetical protein